MSQRLLHALVTTDPLGDAFSDAALIEGMLRFETGLAQVQARFGIIPGHAAATIARAARVDHFDPSAIADDARTSGTIAIPFLKTLKARVRALDPTVVPYVHWGATSQDVSDTALVLCLGRARRVIAADHRRLTDSLKELARTHAKSVMVGRTLLQPAPPVTFGLKAAGWFASISRAGTRVLDALEDAALLQFGGASGTLAAFEDQGVRVAEELAQELELRAPAAPWHARRGVLASVVCACGVYAGTLGKLARDISLLMQAEVGEALEPGGGSSAMPHKRNPSASAIALAAANRVPGLVASFLAGMVQEHERGVGGWQAEASTIAATLQATGSAAAVMADAVGDLTVHPERMAENIAETRGAIVSERASLLLGPRIGADAAARAIEAALARSAREGRSFGEALAADREAARALTREELASLERPQDYLGSADAFRARLLDSPGE